MLAGIRGFRFSQTQIIEPRYFLLFLLFPQHAIQAIRKLTTLYFCMKEVMKMKSNQSNSRHTTPQVVLHGLKLTKIVFMLSIIPEKFAS